MKLRLDRVQVLPRALFGSQADQFEGLHCPGRQHLHFGGVEPLPPEGVPDILFGEQCALGRDHRQNVLGIVSQIGPVPFKSLFRLHLAAEFLPPFFQRQGQCPVIARGLKLDALVHQLARVDPFRTARLLKREIGLPRPFRPQRAGQALMAPDPALQPPAIPTHIPRCNHRVDMRIVFSIFIGFRIVQYPIHHPAPARKAVAHESAPQLKLLLPAQFLRQGHDDLGRQLRFHRVLVMRFLELLDIVPETAGQFSDRLTAIRFRGFLSIQQATQRRCAISVRKPVRGVLGQREFGMCYVIFVRIIIGLTGQFRLHLAAMTIGGRSDDALALAALDHSVAEIADRHGSS